MKTKTYTGRNLDCISFPLGGIGTGMLSLGGYGHLREWQIMNRPSKNFVFTHSFFTLKVQDGKKQMIKVLQGPAGGSFGESGHSGPASSGEGLPHFRHVSFTGRFPFAEVSLRDPDMPVDVTLEAFNPFIPLNDKDSGIPVAMLAYRIKNKTNRKISCTVFGNLRNMIGHPEKEGRENRQMSDGVLNGLFLTTNKFAPDSPRYGTMVLATVLKAKVIPCWSKDSLEWFWNEVSRGSRVSPNGHPADIGTVAVECGLPPRGEITVPFFIAWHFPVFENYWEQPEGCCSKPECRHDNTGHDTWKNYYATMWRDAWDVARYCADYYVRLRAESKRFSGDFFGGSLPAPVLDAVSSTISILKTPTVIRLENGTLYGFEGCSNEWGCCMGSCTHVWNYAQALPYLFPNLQRSMLESHYYHMMREDGMINFRLSLPLGRKPDFTPPPAADGQMGGIMQVYREWLICGDDAWLKRMWPLAKKALEFAWKFWDADRDGVPEGVQHNTYDIEFFGPNTLTGSLYLGALKAAEKMASYLGDRESAVTYRTLFEKGARWTDKNLFNGEYYEQKVNPQAIAVTPEPFRTYSANHGYDENFPDWPRHQYGKGCLSDQLLGQWYAEMLKLGPLYNRKNVKKALLSIVRYNFLTDFTGHANLSAARTYVLNEESGLLVCTWPKGGRPGTVSNYADEVWTGIEYQVAGHLIYEGLVDKGLAVVDAVRKRYDGERRNPWDDIECGHYYARAMSSYGLLLALSGFFFSAPEKILSFGPRISHRDFSSFFCTGSAWGVYRQRITGRVMRANLELHYGSLELSCLRLNNVIARTKNAEVSVNKKKIPARLEKAGKGIAILWEDPVILKQGDILTVVTAVRILSRPCH